MGRLLTPLLGLIIVLVSVFDGSAHFAVIIPSEDIIGQNDQRRIFLRLYFMHPFEQTWLDLEKPRSFNVLLEEERTDLLNTLQMRKVKGKRTWEASYTIRKPGDYIFYFEPNPYWEISEEKFIIHYPKVVINALGKEGKWFREVGLPVEIVPLTRPYGIWVGNTFQGIVKAGGKPLPFCRVEVEYFNEGQKVKAPKDPYITQVIKTNADGVFTYTIPRAGWWGFSAITEAPFKMRRNGNEYPVEIGGVIWVRAREMK